MYIICHHPFKSPILIPTLRLALFMKISTDSFYKCRVNQCQCPIFDTVLQLYKMSPLGKAEWREHGIPCSICASSYESIIQNIIDILNYFRIRSFKRYRMGISYIYARHKWGVKVTQKNTIHTDPSMHVYLLSGSVRD